MCRFLKQELPTEQGGGGGVGPGNDLVWNFNKFLIDRHGRPQAFYFQAMDQHRLETDVFMVLGGKGRPVRPKAPTVAQQHQPRI